VARLLPTLAKAGVLAAAEQISSRLPSSNGIEVLWFDRWSPRLDEALARLPELELCPHDVYRALAQNPATTRKRLALVTHAGEPVAVVCVRRRHTFWEPVLEEAIPFSLFPARPEFLGVALQALGLEIRSGGQPVVPVGFLPGEATPYLTYRADLTGDFEAHWRKQEQLYTIRKARKRTAGMRFRWDHPDDLDWIVATWLQMWKDDPEQQAFAAGPDRLLASRLLLQRGLLHSVALLDGEVPIAGATHVRLGRTLVFHCTARDRTRDLYNAGTRVLDESFHWAATAGFQSLDMGGGMGYKRRWAPEGEQRYHLTVQPRAIAAGRELVGKLRSLKGYLGRSRRAAAR
jgi:hypothetical protein